ncbi:Sterile alpha motif domain-containing protein 13 [Pseudolycoriella hygida]|uniref:Sterile alpha motif domain-containing protein 13 n=1 Tax=Pseudolycoriella hygida TaxID=35572 RepID=A0A9Q0RUC1_9DIPT|nr:Sterile alpha motif domain-containing protein 13 [Pseudolycoriella hygida]
MQSLTGEKKRNQRKSPLTPKKSYRKEDSPPPAPMRVGGRLKKAKVPFDPSDAIVVKRRQTDSSVSSIPPKKIASKDVVTPMQSCCHCKKYQKPEILVNCRKDCKTKKLSWECYSCQSCTVCLKGVANGKILKCYSCFLYYHPKCHGSEDRIQLVKENRFCCESCNNIRIINETSVGSKGGLPKKGRLFAQTRVQPANTDNSKYSTDCNSGFLGFNLNEVVEKSSDDEEMNDEPAQPTVPDSLPAQSTHRSSIDNRNTINDDSPIVDASEWSTEQVFKYFQKLFPKQAHVFRDHDIDGPSLYLLKRSDIVKGFNINIGPAVKIYSHVLKLQTKCNDPTIAWH